MDEKIKQCGIIVIILVLAILYSYNCRIDRLNDTIEDLQAKIKQVEIDKERAIEGLCFKNLSPFCVQYNADKKLINDVFRDD